MPRLAVMDSGCAAARRSGMTNACDEVFATLAWMAGTSLAMTGHRLNADVAPGSEAIIQSEANDIELIADGRVEHEALIPGPFVGSVAVTLTVWVPKSTNRYSIFALQCWSNSHSTPPPAVQPVPTADVLPAK